jgi:hypothetical protein
LPRIANFLNSSSIAAPPQSTAPERNSTSGEDIAACSQGNAVFS